MTEQGESHAEIVEPRDGDWSYDGAVRAFRVADSTAEGGWRIVPPAPVLFVVPAPAFVTLPGGRSWQQQADPWCLGCGARCAPEGLPAHTRWHNPASRPEVIAEGEARSRGLL